MTLAAMPWAALAAATLALAGCSGEDDASGEATEVSEETLAALVADADELSTVSGTFGEAGLAEVFDGVAAYTLFAPQDAAFEGLGEGGEELRTAEQRPAMVAILRDHIVPGYLTPEDIGAAIDQADNGEVQMRNMGGNLLTFSRDGDAIVVANEDGASARFSGEALRARNGVAVPIDAVLVKLPETAAN